MWADGNVTSVVSLLTAGSGPLPDRRLAMQTIVLIHGLWLNPLSWEGWKERFEAKGHRVLAPAWPGLDKPVDELRRDTSGYERLGLKEITDSYDRAIRELDQLP